MSHAQARIERVWSLMNDVKVAMVVTHNGHGDQLRARPMAAHPDAGENAIYFLTDSGSPKDDEVSRNDNVCVTFSDAKAHKFVSVTGRGEMSNDRPRIAKLWTAADKAFWKDENDPAIRLFRVTPEDAEYWESQNFVVTSVKMIAAGVTGKRPDLGENEKVHLTGTAPG
ncbi:MAG: pyridoxamine 5'-phosphate oxidase family protein [Roseiarcus sp.]|jgi:general stress protein 26